MKVRNTQRHADEKVEIQMTPMIDIVFQLLVFFIMTFKIVSPEGNFNIKMPIMAPSEGQPDPTQMPPIEVRLKAGPDGRLIGAAMNNRPLAPVTSDDRRAPFRDLQQQIREIVGDDRGPGSIAAETEVALDCDYQLRFEHVIEAITAVSGYVDNKGNIIKVIEKIRFDPARGGP